LKTQSKSTLKIMGVIISTKVPFHHQVEEKRKKKEESSKKSRSLDNEHWEKGCSINVPKTFWRSNPKGKKEKGGERLPMN